MGFIYAGLGGAILGIILGIVGVWSIVSILKSETFWGAAAMIVALSAIVGAFKLLVMLIKALWNVGKP